MGVREGMHGGEGKGERGGVREGWGAGSSLLVQSLDE